MSTANRPELRFLCFGVGAIGTYIGGSLALSGQNVVFLERPSVAEEVRPRGLSLKLADGEQHVDAPVIVGSIDEALTLGPFDVALVAVKAYDTLALAESLRPYAVALPPVLSLQNGVENEARWASVLGQDKIIAGTVTTAVGRRGAGDIAVEKLRGMGVASGHVLSPTLTGVLGAAGLRAHEYSSSGGMKWSKMLTNLLANASSAILDMTPAEIFAHPQLYRMEIAMYREALRVMAAQHIPVIDLPSTPVRALSLVAGGFPAALSQPLLARILGKGRGAKMPSFHIDLMSGRGQSEVDDLNGAVVRWGQHFGIPTPVNQVLNQTLLGLTRGDLSRQTFMHQPENLLALVEQARRKQ